MSNATDEKKTPLPEQSATTNGVLGEEKKAPLREHRPKNTSHSLFSFAPYTCFSVYHSKVLLSYIATHLVIIISYYVST